MAAETWSPSTENQFSFTTTFVPKFTEPQAPVPEENKGSPEDGYYEVNSTAEAMSEDVLLMAKKNSPEKWGEF